MKEYCITGKRIIKFQIPNMYDINKIQVGIPVLDNEAKKVGLQEVGDIVLPSGKFGLQSRRNAYGYSYADKTKEKELRYVSTNSIYPFGNTNASMILVDIYRECYPKIEVAACGIELELYEDESKQQFVIINMTDEIRKNYLKKAINLMLEIYGKCYIYNDAICIETNIKRKRCNWEILPAGEMPSRHVGNISTEKIKKTEMYNVARLEYIEMYNAIESVEGINGFKGYYAFLYERYCVLESAIYGNATYIIPKENWEELSQKTKKELFDENKVVAKIDHTKNWKQNIAETFCKLGIA